MIEIYLLLLLWFYIVLQLLVLAGFGSERTLTKMLVEKPEIAILIPARNEAANIGKCLESILKLNYPIELITVYIGNDGSTDETKSIVEAYQKEHSLIKLLNINSHLGSARAKGNVLAQLINHCEQNYIFVTDADILVAQNWVSQLLPLLMQENYGIVCGSTLVDGENLFAKLQGLEWTLGIGYMIGLDHLGIKSTAVGNNMCFSRMAYQTTGGFENMPFSVTEDFQLFQAIRKKGFQSVNLLEADSLNISSSQINLRNLLHQRKRWMIGAGGLPWYWLIIFGLQAIFYPALITLLFYHPATAFMVWGAKIFLQSIYLILIHLRVKRKIRISAFLLFEPYTLFMNLLMMLFYLIPVKMVWKGREY